MQSRPEQLIRLLGLTRHPEGGYFRETYRSTGIIPGAPPGGDRNFSTAIFFLLVHPETSRFHRLLSDEIWHFHEGSPVALHLVSPGGEYAVQLPGPELEKGQSYQVAIPAHTWFAAEVLYDGGHALMGCTVAPGFDFRDFKLGGRDDLTKLFPAHGELIRRFT